MPLWPQRRSMATVNRRSTTHLRVQRKPSAAADTTRVTLGVPNHVSLHRGSGETKGPPPLPPQGPAFLGWSVSGAARAVRRYPVPCAFALSLMFFMGVEYTIPMVASSSPPVDFGFIATEPFHRVLAASPALNNLLAALNTVFVGMQTVYILWTFLVEGRLRPGTAALFMFTCRGILGCFTQLPLPHGFLGSGVDFPVGNVSFFLFYSGHVAGAVIASLDMRRTRRHKMASTFDALNLLQAVRLLAARGHYTIDLAVGVGAGYVFDVLAGNYEDSVCESKRACCACGCKCSKQ